MESLFIHFASDLSVLPQYDVSINLPVINGKYRNSYSSLILLHFPRFYFESFFYSNCRLNLKKKKGEKEKHLKKNHI